MDGAVNGWCRAPQRFSLGSHSNMGKSTTHSGCQPGLTIFRSRPTFTRSAASESLTTFFLSAPKNTRSPSFSSRREISPCTVASGRNFMIGDCRPSRPFATSLTLM